MSERATAARIWEDNPDTPITSSNLSKIIDYQSESKFIHFTDDAASYIEWADEITTVADWGTLDPNEVYPPGPNEGEHVYTVGDIYYNTTLKNARQVVDSSGIYVWGTIPTPYKKLLKITAKTKIAMDYVDGSENKYLSFNFGTVDQVFSYDDLIDGGDDFEEDVYYIYLYYYSTYGDDAALKIVKSSNDTPTASWKIDEHTIAYRKIGRFEAVENTENGDVMINEESLWDLSTYRHEITVDQQTFNVSETKPWLCANIKVYDELRNEVRHLKASDIALGSSVSLFAGADVDDALFEVRNLLQDMYGDFYKNFKFGVELKYSPFRKSTGGPLETITATSVALKITGGFIDVFGSRITFDEDVYLSDDDFECTIVEDTEYPITGGIELVAAQVPADKSKIYPGIWRVYLNLQKVVYLIHSSYGVAQYSPTNFGWYNINYGIRCIGKFRVTNEGGLHIEKQSVTTTLDTQVPVNSIIVYHGSMCPDGMIPCDGKWHDITGQDTNPYSTWATLTGANPLNLWGSKWYEETPDMTNRTTKMYQYATIPDTELFDYTTGAGGSEDCGVSGGSADHDHVHIHSHERGTFQIIGTGGVHTHTDMVALATTYSSSRVQEDLGGIEVAAQQHSHTVTLGGGTHTHSTTDFQGNTSNNSGSEENTDESSSWPPYKEILYCIKK